MVVGERRDDRGRSTRPESIHQLGSDVHKSYSKEKACLRLDKVQANNACAVALREMEGGR